MSVNEEVLIEYIGRIGRESADPLKAFEEIIDAAYDESVERLAICKKDDVEFFRGYMAALREIKFYNSSARSKYDKLK